MTSDIICYNIKTHTDTYIYEFLNRQIELCRFAKSNKYNYDDTPYHELKNNAVHLYISENADAYIQMYTSIKNIIEKNSTRIQYYLVVTRNCNDIFIIIPIFIYDGNICLHDAIVSAKYLINMMDRFECNKTCIIASAYASLILSKHMSPYNRYISFISTINSPVIEHNTITIHDSSLMIKEHMRRMGRRILYTYVINNENDVYCLMKYGQLFDIAYTYGLCDHNIVRDIHNIDMQYYKTMDTDMNFDIEYMGKKHISHMINMSNVDVKIIYCMKDVLGAIVIYQFILENVNTHTFYLAPPILNNKKRQFISYKDNISDMYIYSLKEIQKHYNTANTTNKYYATIYFKLSHHITYADIISKLNGQVINIDDATDKILTIPKQYGHLHKIKPPIE